jgi:hypothetical protein
MFLFQWIGGIVVLVGIWAISGGFFLHMAQGKSGHGLADILVTNIGAALLALAVLFLGYVIIVGRIGRATEESNGSTNHPGNCSHWHRWDASVRQLRDDGYQVRDPRRAAARRSISTK